MSNTAILRSCLESLSASAGDLTRIAPCIGISARQEIECAVSDIATAIFHLSIALRLGVEPTIEGAVEPIIEGAVEPIVEGAAPELAR